MVLHCPYPRLGRYVAEVRNLCGIVLDVYDDTAGRVASELFQDAGELPDVVKTAAALSPDVARRVPDDLHALVLCEGDRTYRKYACVDGAHTWLHVRYFLKTGHKLPPEAQKTAARNLVKASQMYGLPVPDALEKVAFGKLLMGALIAPDVIGKSKENLRRVKPLGGQVATPGRPGIGPQSGAK